MKLNLFILGLITLAAHAYALVARDKLLLPHEDPFFQPPDGWQDKEVGTILRSRKVTIKTLVKDNLKEAWQLLYRTTYTSDDEPTTTVTTVMVPHNAQNDSLVLFADFEDSSADRCAPSYSWRAGSLDDPSASTNVAIAMLYLQEGYIVTMPDKEGNRGAFGSGHVEGRQSLDGIRATLAFDKLGLSKDTRVAGHGYSGGGIQIGWAASLKKTYAPELNVVGWSAGGVPSNLTALIEKINGSPFAGFVVAGLTGVSSTYPEVKEYMEKVFTKQGLEDMEFPKKFCSTGIVLRFLFKDFFAKDFSKVGDRYLYEPVVRNMLEKLTMGTNPDYTPDAPMLLMQAKNDEVAPYEAVKKTYDSWCQEGAQVHLVTLNNPLSGHASTTVTSSVPGFLWVRDRLQGKPAESGCHENKNFDVGINTNALGEDFKGILGILQGFLGDKIGPNDEYLIDWFKKHK